MSLEISSERGSVLAEVLFSMAILLISLGVLYREQLIALKIYSKLQYEQPWHYIP